MVAEKLYDHDIIKLRDSLILNANYKGHHEEKVLVAKIDKLIKEFG